MATKPAAGYRLNWNPQLAPNDLTSAHVRKVETTGRVRRFWKCGNAAIRSGQLLYLVRTGKGPKRGIIGAGVAVSEPEDGFMGRDGQWVPRAVRVAFHVLALEPFIERDELDQPPFDKVTSWSNATAAGRLPADVVTAIEARLPSRRRRKP